MKNSTRTWTFLCLISISFVLIGHHFAQMDGIIWGVTLALALNTWTYFFGDTLLTRGFKSTLLEGRDPWDANLMARKISKKAKIPTPEIRAIANPSLLAFSLGRNWNNGKIFLSTGTLKTLPPKELEAIIAYQVACIKSFDSLAQSIASAMITLLLWPVTLLDRSVSWAIGRKWEFQRRGRIFEWIVLPICSLILKICISKSSSLERDKQSSLWLDDKGTALASALWKVESYAQTVPYRASAAHAHLFIVNPLDKTGWSSLFDRQSSPSLRIKNLVGYYPL